MQISNIKKKVNINPSRVRVSNYVPNGRYHSLMISINIYCIEVCADELVMVI